MTLRAPTGKSGERRHAQAGRGRHRRKKAMETLKGKARIKRTMWSRRAQEYEAKINSGRPDCRSPRWCAILYRSESQPEQSYSERQLYEAALDRMAREIAAVRSWTSVAPYSASPKVLSKSASGPPRCRRGGWWRRGQARVGL